LIKGVGPAIFALEVSVLGQGGCTGSLLWIDLSRSHSLVVVSPPVIGFSSLIASSLRRLNLATGNIMNVILLSLQGYGIW